MNREILGNFTTICKILIVTIAPSISVYLGFDENTTIALLTAIAGLFLSIVDAQYPNTFLGRESDD